MSARGTTDFAILGCFQISTAVIFGAILRKRSTQAPRIPPESLDPEKAKPEAEELAVMVKPSNDQPPSMGGQRVSKTVTVYDLIAKTTSIIPAAELAPGMVQAHVDGVGLVWVKISQTQLSDYRHEPFEAGIIQIIDQQIRIPLAEVHPLTLAQWEDGFRRDRNVPEQIALWCRIAERFKEFAEAEELDPARQRDCFELMLNATSSPPEHVLKVVTLTAMPRDQARRAVEAFLRLKG